MKKLKMIIPISITSAVLITLIIGLSFAWYTGMSLYQTPIIQSEDFEGLSLTLYRGYDYDYNGVLDSRNEIYETLDSNALNEVKKDLNDRYMNISGLSTYDKITGVIDNNIITYRLMIRNESDKEFSVNPYFIFAHGSSFYKHNNFLFTLRGLNQFNHTFRNKDGDLIDTLGGENHFNVSTKKFYEYDLTNGLYDTYMNPIEKITDGVNVYRISYGENSNTVYLNDVVTESTSVNLTAFYYYDSFNASNTKNTNYTNETVAYDTKSVNEAGDNLPYHLSYNCYNSRTSHNLFSGIDNSASVGLNKYYPSNYIPVNKNLSLLMYREKITNDIYVDSYSEYYLDYYIVVDSGMSSLLAGVNSFATLHNVDKTTAITTTDTSGYAYDYKVMYQKYNEMRQYSEIKEPNFKVESFCFDVSLVNLKSSYYKEVS